MQQQADGQTVCLSVCLSAWPLWQTRQSCCSQSPSDINFIDSERGSQKRLKGCTVCILQGVLYSQKGICAACHLIDAHRNMRSSLAHFHETRNVQTSCTNFHASPIVNMATTVRITFMPLRRFSWNPQWRNNLWLSGVPNFIEIGKCSKYRQNFACTLQYNSTTRVQHHNSITVQYNTKQYNSTTVREYNSTTARQYKSTTVQQYNSTTARQYKSTTVQQYDSTTAQQYNSTTVQHYNSTTVQQHNSPQARLPTAPLTNCRPNIKLKEFSELFILSKTVPHSNTNLRSEQTPTCVPMVEVLFKGPLQLLALLTKRQMFVQPVPTNGVWHGWRGVQSPDDGLFMPSLEAGNRTQHGTSKSSSTNHNTEHANPTAHGMPDSLVDEAVQSDKISTSRAQRLKTPITRWNVSGTEHGDGQGQRTSRCRSYSYVQVKVRVKQSRYRPGVAQRVPGS